MYACFPWLVHRSVVKATSWSFNCESNSAFFSLYFNSRWAFTVAFTGTLYCGFSAAQKSLKPAPSTMDMGLQSCAHIWTSFPSDEILSCFCQGHPWLSHKLFECWLEESTCLQLTTTRCLSKHFPVFCSMFCLKMRLHYRGISMISKSRSTRT